MSLYAHQHDDTLVHKKSPFTRALTQKLRLVWQGTPLYPMTLMGKTPQLLKVIPTDPWPGDVAHGRLLLDGKMMVESTVIRLTDLWFSLKPSTANQMAQIHSFEYLRDLRAVGDNAARRLARQLISLWIEKNQNVCSLAWRSDIVGCRVSNWIGLYDFFCASADEAFQRLFFKSLVRQVRHLSHTWQNASSPLYKFYGIFGLIVGTIALDEESYKLPKLLTALDGLLQQQIYPDGGHSTRSPLVQLVVLRMLIDLRAILRSASLPTPSELQRSINKMAPLVRLFRHGDGGIASFDGPSSFSPNLIDMILSLADVRGKPPARAGSMGYERCVTKGGLLLFNAAPTLGQPLPKSIEPGTGILNFEWSLGRERLVTHGDTIVQTTKNQYLKAPPSDPALFVHRKTHNKDVFIEATYHSSTSFLHRRQLYLNGDISDLRGEDHFETGEDCVFAIRFILSHHLSPYLSPNGKSVLIRLSDGRTIKLSAAGHDQMSILPLHEHQDLSCILILGKLLDQKTASVRWAFREV